MLGIDVVKMLLEYMRVHSTGQHDEDKLLSVFTHLSDIATDSGSVGGIMKQTAGAVTLCPAGSFTSHLDPLLRSNVYRSPRTICPFRYHRNQNTISLGSRKRKM